MIKNREIIQSIPLDKKLEMITDGNLLGTDGISGSLPRVIPASVEGVNAACGGIYPSFPFLANCWDNALISRVTGDLSLRAKAQGVNLLFTPEGKTKSNPYSTGISEDPFYSASVLLSVVKQIKSAGVAPCVTGCALTDCDVDYLDVFPDSRAIHEYIFRPLNFLNGSYGNIFMTSFTRLAGKYEKVNCGEVSRLLHAIAGDGGFVICSKVESGLAAESVAAGNAFAYASDLSELKASGISTEKIDEAADKTVDFALFCNMGADAGNGDNYDTEALSLQAAEESIVLLKNDGALPLSGTEKLGVIGQPAFIPNAAQESFLDFIAKRNVPLAGAAQGYTLSDGGDDALLAEAAALAKKCDKVILFLGLDPQGEENLSVNRRLKLPENRLALISALKDSGAKIIAVLTTAQSVDVSFDGGVSALLTAPLHCARGGEALLNILYGKSPCGKLANTLYAGTDGYFEKIKNDKDCGRIRIGVFSGYRYYATAGVEAKYPFGHGLGYTKFVYSDLSVEGGQVLITVKNAGSRDGCETVQLYTGLPGSEIARPAKELKSFIKVRLRAGEAKTLRFNISREKLAVYCRETGKYVTESGTYNIYVGSSVSDIRLTGKMQVQGAVLKPDNVRLSDYIPTLSNVVEGGYTLAPVQRVAPDGNRFKFAGLILMLAAALGAVIFAVLNLIHVMSFGSGGAAAFLTFIVAFFIAAAALLVAGYLQTRAAKAHPAEASVRRPEAVKAESDSLDSLFEQEFGEEKHEQENGKLPGGDGQEILKYADMGPDFFTAADNLCVFCAERGLSLDIDAARKILSAFAATRVILLKSPNSALLNELLKLLCDFFGAERALENYGPCEGFGGFLNSGGGSILNAINRAAEEKQLVQPLCVQNAEINGLDNLLVPFEDYFKNPEEENTLRIDGKEETLLPHNLWFAFALSDNSYLSDAGLFTAETACVLEIELAPAKAKDKKTEFETLNCYRLKKLSDAAKKEYSLDEEKGWKKVDKFEKFICSHTHFEIGNKRWQAIEKFVSAYLAGGGKEPQALDNVIASLLLIAACANLNGKLKPSDGSVLSAAENIFGEENIAETKKILKYSGLTAVRRAANAGK